MLIQKAFAFRFLWSTCRLTAQIFRLVSIRDIISLHLQSEPGVVLLWTIQATNPRTIPEEPEVIPFYPYPTIARKLIQ